VAFCVLMCR